MTEYLDKLNQLDQELKVAPVHQQVQEINQIVQIIEQKEVVSKAIKPLGILPDQFEDIISQIGETKREKLTIMNHLLNGLRQYLSLRFGIWSLPNLQTAELLKNELDLSTALEIMAGNAYWSKALQEVGIQTVATDSLEWAKTSKTGQNFFTHVEDLDAASAIKKYPKFDLILCSWAPNFGKNDLAVVNCWRQFSSSKLIFIGEKEGATNSSEFWQQMHFVKNTKMHQINASFHSYDFINEQIFEIEK